MMNAIYDAPEEAPGASAAISRSAPIELQGKRAVDFRMGFDGDYASFTVMDRFGTINKGKLLTHLMRMYVNKEYQVNDAVMGAGLGLAATFRTGGSLLFVTEPGVRSEVTVFFKQTSSFKEFRKQFRFVSIHLVPESKLPR